MKTRHDKHIFICTKKIPKVSFHLVSLYYLIEHGTWKQFFFFSEKLIGNECAECGEKSVNVQLGVQESFQFHLFEVSRSDAFICVTNTMVHKAFMYSYPAFPFISYFYIIFFILSNYNFAFFILLPSWTRHDCFMYVCPIIIQQNTAFFVFFSLHRVFASFRLEKLQQSREIWE